MIGSSLDATSKIYGLRVDLVHSDVLRMTTGFGKFKVGDDDNDQNDNQTNETMAQDPEIGDDGQPKPAPEKKKKRTRKQLSTVTKNKETLNARLETIPLPDPLFSKLNAIMGDVSSSNRLLLNVLQTKESDLKLVLNDKFWDARDCPVNEYSETNEYDWIDDEFVGLKSKLKVLPKHRLRQQMSGYLITNTPMDDDE